MPSPRAYASMRAGDASVTRRQHPEFDARTAETVQDHSTARPTSASGPMDAVLKALAHGADPPPEPSFHGGQIVAGRFRVVRFIARGGMGEVYEAEDLRLKERVALKTIRPEVAQNQRVMERFEREIRLARKVTHQNVCRIYDLQTHRSQDGRDVTFLSMELL